jgi:hypothetical protein
MARPDDPPKGSDHPVQNGLKARRAAIALFIATTFGIMVILSFPLSRSFKLPLELPRPLQAALSPVERLIRPIAPWLGALGRSPTGSPKPGLTVAAGRPRSTSRPVATRPGGPGSRPQPPPPSERPPPKPPSTGTVKRAPTTKPSSGTGTGTVAKGSTTKRGRERRHHHEHGRSTRAHREKHGHRAKHGNHGHHGHHGHRQKHGGGSRNG